MKLVYRYEIIVILLNHSFFYLNYIFQVWLHLFNSFLVLYKVIKLPISCIIFCIIILHSRIIKWVELDNLCFFLPSSSL